MPFFPSQRIKKQNTCETEDCGPICLLSQMCRPYNTSVDDFQSRLSDLYRLCINQPPCLEKSHCSWQLSHRLKLSWEVKMSLWLKLKMRLAHKIHCFVEIFMYSGYGSPRNDQECNILRKSCRQACNMIDWSLSSIGFRNSNSQILKSPYIIFNFLNLTTFSTS